MLCCMTFRSSAFPVRVWNEARLLCLADLSAFKGNDRAPFKAGLKALRFPVASYFEGTSFYRQECQVWVFLRGDCVNCCYQVNVRLAGLVSLESIVLFLCTSDFALKSLPPPKNIA